MDRMIYVSMAGAKALMQRQEALANNLANAGTDGFRADMMTARAVPVRQEGTATTRVYNVETTAGFSNDSGPTRRTGNPLDIAVRGSGWIAVMAADGGESYTRSGALLVDEQGVLTTRQGRPVMGDGGPITVPPNSEVSIGSDGSVSAKAANQPATPIGRIKLVDPPAAALVKGGDGLLRQRSGEPADADPAVRVVDGALEGSNVNVVEAMVGMIEVTRQFEMQMKLLQNSEANDQRAAQLLSMK